MKVKGLKSLFSFKGYVLEKIHFSAEIVEGYLRRDKRHAVKCPDCGGSVTNAALFSGRGLRNELRALCGTR